jgi:hypothetical protein
MGVLPTGGSPMPGSLVPEPDALGAPVSEAAGGSVGAELSGAPLPVFCTLGTVIVGAVVFVSLASVVGAAVGMGCDVAMVFDDVVVLWVGMALFIADAELDGSAVLLAAARSLPASDSELQAIGPQTTSGNKQQARAECTRRVRMAVRRMAA